MDLKGVSAIVTGGASGLGAASALALRAAGARVAIFDTSRDKGQALAAEHGLTFFETDVASEDSVQAAFDGARAAQGVERVLVCCAGIAKSVRMAWRDEATGAVETQPTAFFENVLQINLVGTMRCISRAAAGMMDLEALDADGSRGVIICTGSIAAFDGIVGQTAYSASKAAIGGMMLSLARDLGRYGVRAMAIHPGAFETPLVAGLPQSVWDRFIADVPFPPRMGRPDEFAAAVIHFCQNQLFNGEAVRLDAGVRMRGDLM